MKNIITTLFIVLGFYGLASAQVKEKGDTEFGLEVGLNTSYITDGDNYYGYGGNTDLLAGFNGGVSVDYYFSNQWSLKVKALYDQKGGGPGLSLTDDASGNEVDGFSFKANYITIPVMANWHFGRRRNWYVDFGPYVGILTSASFDGVDVKSLCNSTDVGFRADIGIKIPISDRAKFFVEAGGQSGFTNVFNDGSSLQNETSGINVGLSF